MAGFNEAWAECDQALMQAFGATAQFWLPPLDPTTDPPSGECQADLIEHYNTTDSEGYPRIISVIDLPNLLIGGVKPMRDLKLIISGRTYRLLKRLDQDSGLETWEIA